MAASGLLPGEPGLIDEGDGGFLQLSEGFDGLIRRINRGLGYHMVEQAAAVGDGVLQVTPTASWLRAASRDSHLMAALAFY